MNPDIGIWEIDRSSRAGTKLRLTERVETEEMLEAVLVANPDMLMSGLTLVGRQVPVETGFVDLLGIDEDGRTSTGLLHLPRDPVGLGNRSPPGRAVGQGRHREDWGLRGMVR